MKTIVTTLIIVFLSYFNLHAQTVIQGGDVFGIWKAENGPFLIEGNISVPSDERLEIKPGVEVIFQGQYTFVIEGRIYAKGTSSDNISFTVQDTTGFYTGNFNGWYGLVFDGIVSKNTCNICGFPLVNGSVTTNGLAVSIKSFDDVIPIRLTTARLSGLNATT